MKHPVAPPLVLALSLLATACEDPSKKATPATVGSAAAPAAAPAAGSESLAFDGKSGKLSFVGSKVTGSHDGGFHTFTGTFTLANGKPEGGKVQVEIEMASVHSDNDRLTGHLKSADFFDVEKFPKATFESTEIRAGGEGGASHTVIGNLDLHGVKKSIAFPATFTVTDTSVSVRAEFSINRKDFGIVYAGKPDDLIRDGVVIKLALEAPRKR